MITALFFFIVFIRICYIAIRVKKIRPHFVIGGKENPYLLRWWVIPRNPLFNIYLHLILRSDDDRALHDHPWMNCSIILRGEYDEMALWKPMLIGWRAAKKLYPERFESKTTFYARQVAYRRRAGSIVFRRPDYPHRLIVNKPAWTLFITGPRIREWGFHTPTKWVHWKDFCDPSDPGLARPEMRAMSNGE